MLFASTTLYALPPEIKKDQYMRALAKNIKAKNFKEAETYFNRLDALVKKHKVKLPSAYTHFKAESYAKNRKYELAYKYAEKYINITGNKGRYYSAALTVLDISEKYMPRIIEVENIMWEDSRNNFDLRVGLHEARNYCEELSFKGYNDWVLPDKQNSKLLSSYSSTLKYLDQNRGVYYWFQNSFWR